MAMLWMVVVALVAACDGHPGLIGDLDDEFYSEVRDLLNKHVILQVSGAVLEHSPDHLAENTPYRVANMNWCLRK